MRVSKAFLLLALALALQSPLMLACSPNGGLPKELSEGKVAVMFWSRLCLTCEEVMPYWAELERNPPEGVKVVDVELIPGQTDGLFLELGVRETPTFILFVDGKEVKRFSGSPGDDPRRFLREWVGTESYGTPLSEFIPLPLLGGAISLSPCSLPLMVSLSSMLRLSSRRSYALCFLMVTAGILTLGSVVIVASALAAWIVRGLEVLLAAAAILLGAYSLLLPARACKLPGSSTQRFKGGYLACFSSGLVMVQCNLPLLTGSLILLGSLRDISRGLIGLALLSSSLSLGLILLTSLSRGLTASFTRGRTEVGRLGGALLVALGVYVLLNRG